MLVKALLLFGGGTRILCLERLFLFCHEELLNLGLNEEYASKFDFTNLLLCAKRNEQVEGLMRLMDGEHVGPFNLGNPGEFTMLELAQVYM